MAWKCGFAQSTGTVPDDRHFSPAGGGRNCKIRSPEIRGRRLGPDRRGAPRTAPERPQDARLDGRVGYSFRNASMASKNGTRFFSNSTKWVASLISTLFFFGALVRSRISPSRSSGNDQVSYSPAITSVGA